MGKDKSLVIVESPGKARTITRFLGKDFYVASSFGHIKDLPQKRMGVDIKNNFKPVYVTLKGKRKIINRLKELSRNSKDIYLATDPDREGEAISWHLSNELNGVGRPIHRVIFEEITRDGVDFGMAHPKEIDINKVNAQQARRILDRLVGYKLSPLLAKKVRKGLSAGRVQSVAVRLICEREEEIRRFTPTEYWTIDVKLRTKGGKELIARLDKVDGEKIKIGTKDEAEKILLELEGASFRITKISHVEKRRTPPPPFITSTLQQEAFKRLRFSVKKTMQIAQGLYEGVDLGEEGPSGLITYMRTDSVRISQSAVKWARDYIRGRYGEEFLPLNPPLYKSKEGAQEAHEAIRPTNSVNEPDKIGEFLTKDQMLLYSLIWSRFLASQMKPAKMKTTTIEIEAKGYLFKATGSILLFPGFMAVYNLEEKEDDTQIPQDLEEGDDLVLIELLPSQHFTQPPSRYNEATLVKALEDRGIGRPSTYASILEIIKDRNYVRQEKRFFFPTQLGMIVNGLLVENFPKILDVGFTAQLETRLDEIERGGIGWIDVLDEFWRDFEKTLNIAMVKMRDVKKEEETITEERCELCGGRMVTKTSRYGTRFLGCENFPGCHFTRSIPLAIPCPLPGCNGEIIQRITRKGKVFYGCNMYPECRFATWNEPVNKRCPDCGEILIKRSEDILGCLNPGCTYTEREANEVYR